MALQGKLKIGQKEYGSVQCEYEFRQACDDTSMPSSRPRGGTLTFVMPSTSDDDLFFYKWMFSKTEAKNGTFTFSVWAKQNKQSYKTLEFENAYCIQLSDFFNDSDSRLMYTTVTITAEIINVGNSDKAEYDNEWT
ncbi:MAG: hypothetical protein IJ891_12105 [Prevotella sp.]|jgi:hypothetical protein|nr:hypothetical protein [Prevotella sp.]